MQQAGQNNAVDCKTAYQNKILTRRLLLESRELIALKNYELRNFDRIARDGGELWLCLVRSRSRIWPFSALRCSCVSWPTELSTRRPTCLALSSPPSVGRSNRPSVCTSARSAEAREPLGGFGAGRLPAAQRPHGRRGDIYIYIYMPTHARTRKPAHLCACEPLRSSLHA